MDLNEIRQQEISFIDAYHEITENPYELLLFKIKGSGRHGSVIRLLPSDSGIFVVTGRRKRSIKNIVDNNKYWRNVDLRGIFYQFYYSYRPVLLEYSSISRVEVTSDRLSDWLNIEYTTNRNKKVTANLFYYGVSYYSKHMPRYGEVPKSMRLKLMNVINDQIREKLDY